MTPNKIKIKYLEFGTQRHVHTIFHFIPETRMTDVSKAEEGGFQIVDFRGVRKWQAKWGSHFPVLISVTVSREEAEKMGLHNKARALARICTDWLKHGVELKEAKFTMPDSYIESPGILQVNPMYTSNAKIKEKYGDVLPATDKPYLQQAGEFRGLLEIVFLNKLAWEVFEELALLSCNESHQYALHYLDIDHFVAAKNNKKLA